MLLKGLIIELTNIICNKQKIILFSWSEKKFCLLFKVVTDFIEEKAALDDWRHASGSVDSKVAINIALATSQSNLYKYCINLSMYCFQLFSFF